MSMPATISPYPGDLEYAHSPEDVKRDYLDIVTRTIQHHPRSLQAAIGPSEVGHECTRRLGYKLLDYDENPAAPNWKATIGTSVHAWLEEAFTAANSPDAPLRWIVEATVNCGEILGAPLTGHCDLFDRATGTVIDHKVVGPTQLKKYKSKGPGRQYHTQAHLYGRGWARRGQDVHTVGVMFLPRNGELRDAYYWSEPYDEQVALDGLQRIEGVARTVQALGDAALPVLGTADAFCQMCPYYRAGSTDLENGCPGDPAAVPTQGRDQVLSLI